MSDKINIFLDDVRGLHQMYYMSERYLFINHEFKIIRSVQEFKTYIDSIDLSKLNIISFDHDLTTEHYKDLKLNLCSTGTGGECLLYLIKKLKDNKIDNSNIYIVLHSQNGHAIDMMSSICQRENLNILGMTPKNSRYY